jgi:adenylate cyclase
MMKLEQIRMCLEGLVPSTLATCDADGIPNITYVSQVQYVNENHVALTFQFFNKTRRNILSNPQATLLVIDPQTAAQYHIALLYRRTETSGSLFESMKAKLAGIASCVGMQNVFKLQGADVYQVMEITAVSCATVPIANKTNNALLNMRRALTSLSQADDLEDLFERTLKILTNYFSIQHAMLLLLDGEGNKLYVVDSVGYKKSGIGAEIPLGYGVIGTAAQFQTPIRISHSTSEYTYAQALRDFQLNNNDLNSIETDIAFPSIPSPNSQMAVPVISRDKLMGVIYVESPQNDYFLYDDEDALVNIALFLGQITVRHPSESCVINQDKVVFKVPSLATSQAPPTEKTQKTTTDVAVVRYFKENHSIFLNQDYLIKGVAGAILWRLLQIHQNEGRTLFTNRELRMDKLLKLPDIVDNLEARLILLRRRLAERGEFVKIKNAGWGSFELVVDKTLKLESENIQSTMTKMN